VSESFLQIKDVAYTYSSNGWRLQPVSLDICSGQIVGLIGPNGAGKSTLLKMAAGVLRPCEGRVRLMGEDISGLSRRKIAGQLGYLPQNVSSTFDYRVEEVVAMGRFPHLAGAGFLQREDIAVIERCMEQTETIRYRRRILGQLSGGERQRVLLGSVLAQEPRILLLDEPTTGLDMHYQVGFFALLAQLAEKGMAIAVVTHDLNLAGMFCHKVLLLRDGEAVKAGSVEEVIQQDILSDVYRGSVYVGRHPLSERPIVLPK